MLLLYVIIVEVHSPPCSLRFLQIETSVNDYLLDLVDEADQNKDGRIDFNEWQIMVNAIKKKVCYCSLKHGVSF